MRKRRIVEVRVELELLLRRRHGPRRRLDRRRRRDGDGGSTEDGGATEDGGTTEDGGRTEGGGPRCVSGSSWERSRGTRRKVRRHGLVVGGMRRLEVGIGDGRQDGSHRRRVAQHEALVLEEREDLLHAFTREPRQLDDLVARQRAIEAREDEALLRGQREAGHLPRDLRLSRPLRHKVQSSSRTSSSSSTVCAGCAPAADVYDHLVDLRRLQLSLVAAQLIGAATLLRSVAYNRWITMLASVLLIVGAEAARRGRSWGVGLALGAASAFPVALAIGIAPAWFSSSASSVPCPSRSRRVRSRASTRARRYCSRPRGVGRRDRRDRVEGVRLVDLHDLPDVAAEHRGTTRSRIDGAHDHRGRRRGHHAGQASRARRGQGVRIAEDVRVADSAHADEDAHEADHFEHDAEDVNCEAAHRRKRISS